ncbi:polyprotein [Arachis hypogaea]|nr:polyprotein [Arachis hypogaea]
MHCIVVILKYWRSTPVVSEPQVDKRKKKVLLVKANRLPASLKKTLGNKIDQLVEFTHVPEDSRTPATEYPLISPYSFYHRQKKSTLTSIRHLIHRNPSPPPKEVIQSSSLQQCGLKATTTEQYITLEIPQELIQNYQNQGYTHMHLGAVRLILTLHGRRSLPVTAKVALLDTTFKEYQHALIGALVTTLSNGSVILTIAPNFTMRLSDPTISQRLKIQIQLVGVIQDSNAEQATLHHQVLYRVQDHALDLNLPNTTGEALFMFTDSAGGPAIVDVHTTAPPTITHNSDGTVTTVFQKPGMTKQSSLRRSSFRRINMISPVQVQTTHDQNDPPVHFYENGKPVYVSHTEEQEKKKKSLQAPCSYKRPEPPDDAESAPMLRKKPMIKRTKLSRKSFTDYPFQPDDTIPCIATLRSYEEEFPPLVIQTDEKKITRRPYVIPQGITPHGHQATTPQEEVLNWHTDNAVSQNKVLLRIDHTLDTLVEKTEGLSVQLSSMAEQVAELKDRLSAQAFQLDQELKAYIDNRYFGPEFQRRTENWIKSKLNFDKLRWTKANNCTPDAVHRPIIHKPQIMTPSSNPPTIWPGKQTLKDLFLLKDGIIRHQEGSPAPGRSIYTLTLDTQSPSEEITEESEDETTETSEQEDEESEGDYEADLSAIAMVNPVEEEEEEITSERDEPETSANHDHISPIEASPVVFGRLRSRA